MILFYKFLPSVTSNFRIILFLKVGNRKIFRYICICISSNCTQNWSIFCRYKWIVYKNCRAVVDLAKSIGLWDGLISYFNLVPFGEILLESVGEESWTHLHFYPTESLTKGSGEKDRKRYQLINLCFWDIISAVSLWYFLFFMQHFLNSKLSKYILFIQNLFRDLIW